MKISVTVSQQHDGASLRDYLEQQGYSTTQIKRFKYNGTITVNGAPVTVRCVLKTGDVLQLTSNERLATPSFASCKAEIMFADEYMYVANKPYGVAIHPDRAHRAETFGNMLAATFDKGFQLRIVTRLDKTTSGLVLGALDEITAQKLNDMQSRHLIQKCYVAEVEGIVEKNVGVIELPLARLDGQNKTAVDCKAGKPSTTKYEVVARRENTTLMRVQPLTGRTHQIRAHLAAIGHPIVGDTLYGAQKAQRTRLHCQTLCFVHPYTGNIVEVTAPADF